jgi:hypothetical protein
MALNFRGPGKSTKDWQHEGDLVFILCIVLEVSTAD